MPRVLLCQQGPPVAEEITQIHVAVETRDQPLAAIACGDKFLVIGRGARRVPKARHPASIALYLRVGSPFPAEAKEMRLEKTLKEAGHEVEVIAEESALHRALWRPA